MQTILTTAAAPILAIDLGKYKSVVCVYRSASLRAGWRHGVAYLHKQEADHAEPVRERLERQLHRRARELGYELKKIEPCLATVALGGEVLTVTSDGEIVAAKPVAAAVQ